MSPLILLGAGAAVLLLMSGGNASAQPLPRPAPGPDEEVPQPVIDRMTRAIATGNPIALRTEAAALRRDGYPGQADDLERIAAELDAKKPPAPAPAPAPGIRTLKLGLTGADVRAWQEFLRSDGFVSIVVDSTYGAESERLTREWQADHAIGVDGSVGPETRGAVGKPAVLGKRILKLNSEGPAVRSWQTVLAGDGFKATVGGKFDLPTDLATRDWQRARGLGVDGIVGPKTVAAIGAPKVAVGAAAVVAAAAPVIAAAVKAVVAGNPAALPINPSAWRSPLKGGMSGEDVRQWQAVLIRDGHTQIVADGVYGVLTTSHTKVWQTQRKLDADGSVGPQTRAAIGGLTTTKVAGSLELVGDAPAGALPLMLLPFEPLASITGEHPDRELAARLAEHLSAARQGREDRTLVQKFQALRGLKPSGAYGPGTAEQMALLGVIPPWPFYWPSKQSGRSRAKYRATVLEQARRDELRAAEWTTAANGGPS